MNFHLLMPHVAVTKESVEPLQTFLECTSLAVY